MRATRNPAMSWQATVGRVAVAVVCAHGALTLAQVAQAAPTLQTMTVQSVAAQGVYMADATIEALRETRVASQVQGRITALMVKAGDRVQAGQVLVQMDQGAATQQVSASQAQLAQAQAMLLAAKGDLDRATHLYKKEYLSKAALDHAEAQYKAVAAQARALGAQATGSSVQAAYYTVRAPYAGWVSQVDVSVGDMASPGLPMLTMHDPTALRVSAQVPESVMSGLDTSKAASVSLPGAAAGARQQLGVKTTVLPTVDASTHSATVRVDLAPQGDQVVPGQFARVSLPMKVASDAASSTGGGRLMVPSAAVVVRGELTAVYVVSPNGQVRLRQVRVGRVSGAQTEVLAGLQSGEKIAVDPVAAAQATAR